MEKVVGFKAFNKGLITRQGEQLELKKIYEIEEHPSFGKRGFHMCENLEDTLRYFDCDNIDICRVEGYPEIVKYVDDYNVSGEMYSCQKIKLTHIMTEEEIIEEADKMNMFSFHTFSSLYKLNEEQIKYFVEKYINENWILENIIYHYYDKTIYEQRQKQLLNHKQLIKKYMIGGKNENI